jgi:hypothetical protein
MGDLVPRVARLEADVSQLKVDVAEMKATLPHLATKADLAPIQALLPHFATKAGLASMESRLIRWMVGSWVAMAGLMTALFRFAH